MIENCKAFHFTGNIVQIFLWIEERTKQSKALPRQELVAGIESEAGSGWKHWHRKYFDPVPRSTVNGAYYANEGSCCQRVRGQ
jgi:hypothetical protein